MTCQDGYIVFTNKKVRLLEERSERLAILPESFTTQVRERERTHINPRAILSTEAMGALTCTGTNLLPFPPTEGGVVVGRKTLSRLSK